MRKVIAIAIASAAVILAAVVFGLPYVSDGKYNGKGEEIFGFKETDEGLSVHVRTNGCTEKESFIFSQEGGNFILFRREPDTCKGFFPEGKFILWKWEELGIARQDFGSLKNVRVDR